MPPSEPSPTPPPALTQGDFVRLLMRNEPALRAYSRSLLPDWHLVDEVIQYKTRVKSAADRGSKVSHL